MFTFIRCHAVMLAVLVLALVPGRASWAAPAVKKPPSRTVMAVPGQQDVTCSISSTSSTKNACPTFQVQLFLVVNTANVPVGCIAALPYNTLTVTVGSPAKSGTVTWALPAASAASARFVAPGIAVTSSSGTGPPPSTLFNPTTATLGTNGQTAMMTTIANATNSQSFNHLPVVQYTLPSGTTVNCLGVDPIIINSDN